MFYYINILLSSVKKIFDSYKRKMATGITDKVSDQTLSRLNTKSTRNNVF